MCGICGIIGTTAEKEQVLERMMKAMEHRGPDGRDTYISEDAMLGFQRLSIIDLETGMQPMQSEDRSKALVFNGEIYNYRILREMLRQKGHLFKSDSDSEVILHGYEEYGKAFLDKLRGMFSFAVWDEKERTLFAARDYFGIKPFYYTVIGGTLVFASEIKSILEHPGYCREVNEEALEQYLSFQYSVLPETFFKGIYQLPPGHYLTYTLSDEGCPPHQGACIAGSPHGLPDVARYFDPSLKPGRDIGEERLLEDVKNVIGQSVRRHMVSDVEVASFLSSGVDSSLVAAVSGCSRTFTVGFENEGALYDETACARELADKLKTDHRCRYITKREFTEAVPRVMYHLDEPLGDASAVALYFLAQEASKEVKVVLSGEGADEIFGGYNIYLEPKALRCLKWLPIGARRALASAAEKLPKHMKGRNYLIRASQSLKERYIGNAYIFRAGERRQILRRQGHAGEPQEFLKDAYDGIAHLPDSEQMQSIDIKYWLPGDILQKADKMSMAHSLELRVPFLDRDVFQVARQIPHRLKTKHYTTKYMLRRAADAYLPEKVSHKKKLGFPVPIRNWMKEQDWYKEIEETFTGSAARKYFNTERLTELLEEHRDGKEDNSRKIWTVYAFLVWYRVFFEDKVISQV